MSGDLDVQRKGTASPTGDQPRFAYWDHDGTWAAYIAARIPAFVVVEQLDATQLNAGVIGRQPTCLLLADDVAALDVLHRCVRDFADARRSMILIAQRSAEARVGDMLLDAGAHGVVHNMGELVMWTPAIRKWFESQRSQAADSCRARKR
jgi:hypothetical protein